MSIYEEKKRLRIEVLDAIQNLSKNKIRKESEHICKEIAERIPLDSAVCAYSALPDEIDLKPLIKLLIQRGNSVFLPCYEKNMVFRKIDNNTELKKGSYGILEPVSSSTIISPEEINIVL
ncbi:MAG: hypothetical protein KAS32_20825, partial [Candidatus Peribacteraceae bacterium]|nr:hypothetical protein [Candidatus Peribacteraceae bacterium]